MTTTNPTPASNKRALFLQRLKDKQPDQDAALQPQPHSADGAPLSHAQQRMWFFAQLDGASSAYHMPVALRLRGGLDTDAMRRALQELVARHEILRTRFFEHDGQPRQALNPAFELDVKLLDLAGETEGVEQAQARAIDAMVQQRFDLGHEVFRASLLRLNDDEHVLVLVMHHIVSDGWSLGVIERELDALYDAFRTGRQSPLPALSIQYIDYAIWQRRTLDAEKIGKQLQFWQTELADAPPLLHIPGDRPRPEQRSHAGASEYFRIPAALSERLGAWATERNASLYMVLLAVFKVYLAKYSGADDIVIGTPTANRRRSQLEGLVGFFSNTIALRTRIDGQLTLNELIENVKLTIGQAFSNQDVPFEQVVEHLGIARAANYPPLLQTLFVMQSGPSAVLAQSGLQVDRVELERESVEFDLIVEMLSTPQGLEGVATFSTELYDRATLVRLLDGFVALLERAVDARDQPLSTLALAPRGLAAADVAVPAPWHEQLLRWAHSTPNAIAMTGHGSALTYAEMHRRALACAGQIAARSGVPQPTVALTLSDPCEFAVAALATALLGGQAIHAIDLDGLRALPPDATPDLVLGHYAGPDGVAYLSFADSVEGSTLLLSAPSNPIAYARYQGGILRWVSNAALASSWAALDSACPLSPGDGILFQAQPHDDHFAGELLWLLARGVCVEREARAPRVAIVPADALPALGRLESLTTVLLHGEAPAGLAYPGRSLLMVHQGTLTEGPLAFESLSQSDDAARFVCLPCGAMLCDQHGQSLPAGALGQLFLPAARFTHGERRAAPAALMLGTGLHARDRADGRIELAALPDSVTWLGASSVDAAHLERIVMTMEHVTDCRVLQRATLQGATALVCCVAGAGALTPAVIASFLAGRLPAYAVPAAFRVLPALPRTSSGRVDDAQLRAMPISDSALEAAWLEHYAAMPGVARAAVLSQEIAAVPAPLHVADIVPSWRRRQAHDAAAAAPVTAPQAHLLDARRISIAEGAPLDPMLLAERNLGAVLRRAAAHSARNGISFIDARGARHELSYAALAEDAARLLAGLRAHGCQPGDRVFFQLTANRDIVPAFWACALGGYVAVPLACGGNHAADNAETGKLANAWPLLNPFCVLTERRLVAGLDAFAGRHALTGMRALSLEALRDHAPARDWHDTDPDQLALILLTSGSTGTPKAVTQTHGALLARSAATRQMHGFTSADVSLNWMPLDHVGGLVMFHLLDLFVGCRQIQVSTDWILQDPLRWLDTLEQERATITWAPNFAYALVAERIAEQPQRRWDLSRLHFILNGGEAVVAATARRFLSLLAPSALRGSAMKPAWGMSETCSGVVFSDQFALDSTSDADNFTAVGRPVPGCAIRVADEHGTAVPEGRIGQLQVKGPSVTRGYYGNEAANRTAYSADGWFCTGDLAVMDDGCLTITGREKDLIIVNGANHYSHELERVVDDSGLTQLSLTAACAVRWPGENTDRVAIFFCPAAPEAIRTTLAELRQLLLARANLNPDYLIPVSAEQIPKTSIGKIQRTQLAQQLMAGQFDGALKQVDLILENDNVLPNWFYEPRWQALALRDRPVASIAGQTVLLLEGVADSSMLRVRLQDAGVSIVRAVRADRFEHRADGSYRIDPRSGNDYVTLLAKLDDHGRSPDHIVHLGLFDETPRAQPDADQLMTYQSAELFPLTLLVRALQQPLSAARRIRIHVVTSGACAVDMDPHFAYAKAAVAGLLRTAAHETPHCAWRQIDGMPMSLSRFADTVVAELAAGGSEPLVVYRRKSRLVPRLRSTPFKRRPQGTPLQAGGRYLVTGGLGGVGFHVCEHLLKQYQARLLIVGRSPLVASGDAQHAFEALQARGDVQYAQLDICDGATLEAAVRAAGEAWGAPLSGVIHAAGLFEECLLGELDEAGLLNVLRPKLQGTLNLHKLLKNTPNAFAINFSSVNGFFGGTGVGAYAAASSFLDQFAHYQNANGVRSYCFSFSMWDELGMSRGYQMKELTRRSGFYSMTRAQGIDSFEALLCQGPGQYLTGLDGSNTQIRLHVDGAPAPQQQLLAFVEGDGAEAALAAAPPVRIDGLFLPQSQCAAVALTELPLERDGSIDLARLAQYSPATGSGNQADAFNWRTDTERALASIWEDVLGASRIGREDNFFERGGNSLLVTQAISRIRKALDAEVAVRDIFECPTIATLAERLGGQAAEPGEERSALRRFERSGPLPLSLAQQRLWTLNQLEGASATYNMPAAIRLRGVLDVGALERSFDQILLRHEALRTAFASDGADAVQIVAEHTSLPIERIDLCAMDSAAREREMLRLALEDARRPFVLTQLPLFRVSLIKLADADHVLMIAMHHIISDGWSIGILVREFVTLYAALRSGVPSALAPLPVQYADYTLWQREWLTPDHVARQLDYWREQLKGLPPLLTLSTDFPRPPVQTYRGALASLKVPFELGVQLEQLGQRQGASLYMVLLAAFQYLLQRYSGQDDIAVGASVANRNQAELEQMIGFFANTLVLRTKIKASQRFVELLESVKQTTLSAYANQDVPFDQVVEVVQPERSLSHSPLFQVLFVLLDTPMDQFQLPNLQLTPVDVDMGSTHFDLSVHVHHGATGMECHFMYNTDLFAAHTIERMAGHYVKLLGAIATAPALRLDQYDFLGDDETARMRAPQPAGGAGPLQAIERHAEHTPDALAVIDERGSLSFAALNARANQLAHHLRARGVRRGSRVGLCLPRGADMALAILATMKAGGVFLALDPDYPEQRLLAILEQSEPAVLVTHEGRLAGTCRADQLLEWEGLGTLLEASPRTNLDFAPGADDGAYLIYTSGSNGKPKGILCTHGNLRHYANALQGRLELTGADRYLHTASFSFSSSVRQLLVPLHAGAAVAIAARGHIADPAVLLEQVRQWAVTVVDLVPSYWRSCIDVLRLVDPQRRRHLLDNQLRLALAASEPCTVDIARQWHELAGERARFINMYGQTETCGIVSLGHAGQSASARNETIGSALSGTALYVLDHDLQPCATGVVGDLYVAGDCLGQGYPWLPELTAELFIPNPFSPEPGSRLYATRDRARFLPSGELDLLARTDDQIKIRGFRIQLPDIVAVARSLPGIRDAVVTVRNQDTPSASLALYLVEASPGNHLGELRSQLRARLPDYMMPATITMLDALPRLPNGKVDRAGLPEPVQEVIVESGSRTKNETILSKLWCDLLGTSTIGTHANFFDIGGHSLLVIRACVRLQQDHGLTVMPMDIFQHPTIAGLAAFIGEDEAAPEAPVFSAAQERAQKQHAALQRQRARGRERQAT